MLRTVPSDIEMAYKILFALAFVAVAQAGVVVPAAPVVSAAAPVVVAPAHIEEFDTHPQYRYGYDVHDTLSGDNKGHIEERDGDVVRGEYSLIDADGFKRTVSYTADSVNGFNAIVRRDPLVAPAPLVKAAPLVASPVIKAAPFTVAAPTPIVKAAPLSATPLSFTAPAVAYIHF